MNLSKEDLKDSMEAYQLMKQLGMTPKEFEKTLELFIKDMKNDNIREEMSKLSDVWEEKELDKLIDNNRDEIKNIILNRADKEIG